MSLGSDESKQELFAFFRELERDPKLKTVYFNANNRPDRKLIIESLGFDPKLIQEAVNSLPLEIDGTQTTLADWLRSRQVDPDDLAPLRAVLNALNKLEESGAIASITSSYAGYKGSLDSTAGGAAAASKVPEKATGAADKVETDVESEATNEATSDASSDVSDVRHSYEQAENETQSDVSDQETSYADMSNEYVKSDISTEVSDLKSDISEGTSLYSSSIDKDLSTIQSDLKSDAINEVYSLLTKASDEINEDLSKDGSNAKVTVSETDNSSGQADGVQVEISDSASTDKTEGSTEITGSISGDATLDFEEGSGVSGDVQGSLDIKGSTDIDETNKDGSISGDATFNDQSTMDVDFQQGEKPTVTTESTGLEVDLDAKVNETIKEDYSSGNFSVDGTTDVTGNYQEDLDIDLKDPSESTAKTEASSLDLDQDLKVSGTVDTDVDGVDVSATVSTTVDGDVDISDKGVSTNVQMGDIDVDLKADETKPILVDTIDEGEDITEIYAKPEASVDLSIDPSTGKVDVTGKSVDPGLYETTEAS